MRRAALPVHIPALANPNHPRLAAIDLGSHSFRLTIGHMRDGKLRIDYKLRHVVRLADGIKPTTQQLSPPVCERALASLATFTQVLSAFPPQHWRIVGTETLRRARNKDSFVAAASQVCQHPVEVLTGVEEANLIYLGVAKMRRYETQKRLVVDIGGGSTELIIGEQEHILQTTSLPLGCIAITQQIMQTPANFNNVVGSIRNELLPIAHHYHSKGFDVALGASGAIRAIATVAYILTLSFNYIGLCKLQQLWGTAPHIIYQYLTPHQQAIFPGTLAILLALFDTFELLSLAAIPSSLTEGVLYQLAEK